MQRVRRVIEGMVRREAEGRAVVTERVEIVVVVAEVDARWNARSRNTIRRSSAFAA